MGYKTKSDNEQDKNSGQTEYGERGKGVTEEMCLRGEHTAPRTRDPSQSARGSGGVRGGARPPAETYLGGKSGRRWRVRCGRVGTPLAPRGGGRHCLPLGSVVKSCKQFGGHPMRAQRSTVTGRRERWGPRGETGASEHPGLFAEGNRSGARRPHVLSLRINKPERRSASYTGS